MTSAHCFDMCNTTTDNCQQSGDKEDEEENQDEVTPQDESEDESETTDEVEPKDDPEDIQDQELRCSTKSSFNLDWIVIHAQSQKPVDKPLGQRDSHQAVISRRPGQEGC